MCTLKQNETHNTLPNLWHPRKDNYFQIDEMPALGSGKLDMKQLKTIAGELVEAKAGGDRMVFHLRPDLPSPVFNQPRLNQLV
jgi:hypothetical protein